MVYRKIPKLPARPLPVAIERTLPNTPLERVPERIAIDPPHPKTCKCASCKGAQHLVRERAETAREIVRQVRGGKPPKGPDHAIRRVAFAAANGNAVPCSRYGAEGGIYLGLLEAYQEVPNRPGATLGPRRLGWRDKVRRVMRHEALAIIRRPATDAPVGRSGNAQKGGAHMRYEDRIVALYWIPPELVLLFERPKLVELIQHNRFLPVWTKTGGKLIGRGHSVLAPEGSVVAATGNSYYARPRRSLAAARSQRRTLP